MKEYSLFGFICAFLNEDAKICLSDDHGSITYSGLVKDLKAHHVLGKQFVSIDGLGQENDLMICYRYSK